jgi:SecD/SecF fusion protein
LVTIIALASIGVQSLTEFAVPIIVGLVCGVYSTMLIAPALWGTLIRAQQNKGQKKSNANFAKSKSKKTHVNKVSA